MSNRYTIMGGIVGDIAGSRFEFAPHRSKDFELLVMGKNYLSRKPIQQESQLYLIRVMLTFYHCRCPAVG